MAGRGRRWLAVIAVSAVMAVLAGCASTPFPTPSELPAPDVPVAQPDNPLPAPLRRPRIALALGGGAARGFAHVGVIQVLEEAGIRPDLVVGTSAGSLVAALYASGNSGTQLQKIAETMDEATFTDWSLPLFNRGVLRGDALARYVSQQVGGKRIEELGMPLGILATDLQTGEGVLFERGDIATAVRASSAVPGLFQPVRISGRDYVDGGLVAPVPARQARQMGAELVIAVDISSQPEANGANDLFHILLQTFSIMSKTINSLELKGRDMLVVRPALAGIGGTDFAARSRAIQAGRDAMLQALPQLRQAIQSSMRPVVAR